MPLIYRVMTPDSDRPKLGTTNRTLGIRLAPLKYKDISELNADGTVAPGQGGMSVGPRLVDLPKFLVPERLRKLVPGAYGDDDDCCWSMGDGPFVDGVLNERLTLRVDRPGHGLIEPAFRMPVADFLTAIAATRDQWKKEF